MSDYPDEPPPDDTSDPDTTPGVDEAAERAVLGAMMLSRAAIDEVEERCQPTDHHHPRHEAIHAAILDLHRRGEPTDTVAVAGELTRTGDLGRAGGAPYLHTVISSVPTAANAGYYARQVHELAGWRRLASAGVQAADLARRGLTSGSTLADAQDAARATIDAAIEGTATSVVTIGQSIYETLATLEAGDTSIPTPWPDLDHYIGGLRPGALYVVAARPGNGKSIIGTQLALSVARGGAWAAFSSLEMSRDELNIRWIAQAGQVTMNALTKPNTMTERDWQATSQIAAALQGLPVAVDDRSGVTMWDVRQHARSVSRKGPLGVVVVDYLQLANVPHQSAKKQRHEQVGEMSKALKQLARDLRVPVVCLAQLNRASEARADKRPAMSDLRESGSIEADADVVILLHRDPEKAPDLLELHIPKNRQGPVGGTQVSWQGHYSRVMPQQWTPSSALGERIGA